MKVTLVLVGLAAAECVQGFVLQHQPRATQAALSCTSSALSRHLRHRSSSNKAAGSCLRMTDPDEVDDVGDDTIYADEKDPMDVVPIIYKRLDETYESKDYEGAFSLPEVQYDTNPTNVAGERMLRVLVLGGSSSEAKILSNLSAMDDLVCGMYTSWDDTMGELHESIPDIPYNNLYPCEDPADPQQQAGLAKFIRADVVIAGGSYSVPAKAGFVAALAKELQGTEIIFVPPSGAGAMLSGDYSVLRGQLAMARQ